MAKFGKVHSEKRFGQVGVTSNAFRAFPKRLDASKAYRTVKTRQKRSAAQILVQSKRINLGRGRGTLEDPILID